MAPSPPPVDRHRITRSGSIASTVLVSLVGLTASCSPRYSIVQVTAPDFAVDVDLWIAPDTALTIAYDFWGPTGQPFVSVYNSGPDTAWLDLTASYVLYPDEGRIPLLDLLGGFPGARREDVRAAYPELALNEDRSTPKLILAPDSWSSWYGLPPSPRTLRTRRDERRQLTFGYVWEDQREPQRIVHELGLSAGEGLRGREFRRFEASVRSPDRFALDRGPDRRRQAIQIALQIATGVLVAL